MTLMHQPKIKTETDRNPKSACTHPDVPMPTQTHACIQAE